MTTRCGPARHRPPLVTPALPSRGAGCTRPFSGEDGIARTSRCLTGGAQARTSGRADGGCEDSGPAPGRPPRTRRTPAVSDRDETGPVDPHGSAPHDGTPPVQPGWTPPGGWQPPAPAGGNAYGTSPYAAPSWSGAGAARRRVRGRTPVRLGHRHRHPPDRAPDGATLLAAAHRRGRPGRRRADRRRRRRRRRRALRRLGRHDVVGLRPSAAERRHQGPAERHHRDRGGGQGRAERGHALRDDVVRRRQRLGRGAERRRLRAHQQPRGHPRGRRQRPGAGADRRREAARRDRRGHRPLRRPRGGQALGRLRA